MYRVKGLTIKVEKQVKKDILFIFAIVLFILFSTTITICKGDETNIGTKKVWIQPGGSKYDSISLNIREEIYNKLPSSLSSFSGFSLIAEIDGEPPFIHHRVDDAKASKLKSGFISKCQLHIYYRISVDNGTQDGTYTYDVVYNLQHGLLTISCQYVVEVNKEKPQWVYEAERELESFGFIITTSTESVLFIGIPLLILIRKLRRPWYVKGTLGRARTILGGAIALFAMFLTVLGVYSLLQGATGIVFQGIVYSLIFCAGLLLISINILKP